MPSKAQGSSELRNRRFWIAAIPLIVFLALAGIFYKQLASGGSSSELPSVLVGRKAPDLSLPQLDGLMRNQAQVPGIAKSWSPERVTVLNVWASWCVPCRAEHPLISELGRMDDVRLIGLNYKDKRENALRFLGQLGNPFAEIGVDQRGQSAIDWGVYGVPETFIVDRDGVIRYKHIGPLTEDSFRQKFLPELEKTIARPAGS